MKTIEFIDCKDGSVIEDLCNKIIIFSKFVIGLKNSVEIPQNKTLELKLILLI